MGIEYQFHVPPAFQAAVAEALQRELATLLDRVDPRARELVPTVSVTPIPEGVHVCDHLQDAVVAAQVMWRVLDLVLRHSSEVKVVEP